MRRIRIVDLHQPIANVVVGIFDLLLAELGVDVDLISLTSHIDPDTRRVLFKASNVVLANSAREPFGLVGLEAMAVGYHGGAP